MIASTNGEYEVSLLYSIRTYEAMKDVDSVEGGRIYSVLRIIYVQWEKMREPRAITTRQLRYYVN